MNKLADFVMSEAIEIYDERLKSLLRPDATLQKLTDGAVHGEGPVYFDEDDSVQIYAPDGTRLGKIPVPETCTNLTFGGKKRDRNCHDFTEAQALSSFSSFESLSE